MEFHQYLVFLSIAFFYIISPGPAVFLAINYGAVHGIKKTASLALGNSTGLAVLAIFSALGLGAVIIQSFLLLSVIKVLGALVLFYLGCKMLWSAMKPKIQAFESLSKPDDDIAKTVTDNGYFSFYKKGLFLSLTNPKAIIFFTAIFPQFMTAGKSVQVNLLTMFFLGITFAGISFVSLNVYGLLGQKILSKVLTDVGLRILDFISGATFVVMSGMLAFSDLSQRRLS